MIVRTCTPLAAAGTGAYKPATRFTPASYPGTVPVWIFLEIVLDAEMVGMPIPLDAFLNDNEDRKQVGSSTHYVWNHRTTNNNYLSYTWEVSDLKVPKPGEYVLDMYVAARMMRSIVIYCQDAPAAPAGTPSA
jgi:hypothetical protein